jgi:hypothetical protein
MLSGMRNSPVCNSIPIKRTAGHQHQSNPQPRNRFEVNCPSTVSARCANLSIQMPVKVSLWVAQARHLWSLHVWEFETACARR